MTTAIWTGHVALAIGHVLIAIVFLIIFIKSKIKFGIKLILIPIVVWYAFVLLFSVPNLAGWATDKQIPDGSLVLKIMVREPKYIYILANPEIPKEKNFLLKKLNPKNTFSIRKSNEPRFYKIPYSKSLHKDVMKVFGTKNKIVRWYNKKGDGYGSFGEKNGQESEDTAGPFKLDDLTSILRKDTVPKNE